MPEKRLAYKRERFTTRLPTQRLYTPSHYWLEQQESGAWRVGFTKFAMRMLGETVEYEIEVKPEQELAVGDIIAWIEGFKATSDVYSVGAGRFISGNPALIEDPALLYHKMYDAGWFYEFDGEVADNVMDVNDYVEVLDRTIDRILEARHESAE